MVVNGAGLGGVVFGDDGILIMVLCWNKSRREGGGVRVGEGGLSDAEMEQERVANIIKREEKRGMLIWCFGVIGRR